MLEQFGRHHWRWPKGQLEGLNGKDVRWHAKTSTIKTNELCSLIFRLRFNLLNYPSHASTHNESIIKFKVFLVASRIHSAWFRFSSIKHQFSLYNANQTHQLNSFRNVLRLNGFVAAQTLARSLLSKLFCAIHHFNISLCFCFSFQIRISK